MQRAEVLAYRIHAQELGSTTPRSLTEAAVLDLGVQDTGRDGASWALANRGLSVSGPAQLESDPDLALVWTLRSAPHFYRRTDLVGVLTATSPFSPQDATKRLVGAARPLRAAGIEVLDGLAEVARQLRTVVTEPTAKGAASAALSAELGDPWLRDCATCGAVHSWEVPFRLGALYAGLELQPGTSPPVLRPIPDWPAREPGPAADPLQAPQRLQPIRGYLRFLGPATPEDVAAFLDAPVSAVKAHWPEDAVAVDVAGRQAWLLDGADGGSDGGAEVDLVRLLGGFDLFLQGRDRSVIVPDDSRHKALWPTLGRPGAVLAGTDIVGIWRPKTTGRTFTLRLELWAPVSRAVRARIETEAERLAAHRGLSLSSIEQV